MNEAEAFALDADDMAKLRVLQAQLHGGTDRERDYGHRLWLILNRAVPFNYDELIERKP